MSAKNWKFSYRGNGKTEIKQHILDTISLWGAIGLLWYSFLLIIKEHFPEFMEVTVEVENISLTQSSYVGPSTYETYGLDWFIIGIFLFVLWLGYDWPKKYLKKFSLPCHLAGLVIPIVYVIVNFEKVADGIVRLAWFYLPHWNSYYKQNLYMGIPSQEENIVFAFTAICMIFWWLVWALSYVLQRRILLTLFPVIALSAELLVGLSPKGNGLMIALFGAIILTTLGGTSVGKKVVALACVAISLFLTSIFFDGNIKSLATAAKKQEILALQKNFNWNNLLKLIQIDFHFNWEKLGNNAPQYTGKTVLEIESTKPPVTSVYIKGFYGTDYENGNWRYDDSAFREACREAGKSTDEMAQQIFQMPYDRWNEYYNLSMDITYDIIYTGTTGDVAYVPYASNYVSLDEDYTLLGDYLLKKSIWDTSVTVSSINAGTNLSDWYYVEGDEETEFFNSLSDAYLQVPEDAKEFLEQATNEINAAVENTTLDAYSSFYDDGNENHRRIRYGEKVASYLANHMCYSLKLDEIPADVDPIDYAINVSHEGYCMHFASAATLLLRQVGVPARYVSGYTVDKSAFVYDTETGLYKAEVGDFMAHTWVEVYLDNIGWVPLEVTPGSSLENLPTQDDIDRWESLAEAKKEEEVTKPQPSESEETEESEEPTEESEDTETEPDDPVSSEEQQTSESENSENQDPGGAGSGDGSFSFIQILKSVGIIGGVLLLVTAIVMSIKYGVNQYRRVLNDEIEKQMTHKVVKRINRRMYRSLILRNPKYWFAGKMTDTAYETALKEQYPKVSESEWEHFMDIVKKNHYSHDTITVEEMQYCYDCYTKKEKK